MKVELAGTQKSPEIVMLSAVYPKDFAQSPDGTRLYFSAGPNWVTRAKSGHLEIVGSFATPVVVLPRGTQIVLTSE